MAVFLKDPGIPAPDFLTMKCRGQAILYYPAESREGNLAA
jgi:hypothetical protein